jgi:hypothetical protein
MSLSFEKILSPPATKTGMVKKILKSNLYIRVQVFDFEFLQ